VKRASALVLLAALAWQAPTACLAQSAGKSGTETITVSRERSSNPATTRPTRC